LRADHVETHAETPIVAVGSKPLGAAFLGSAKIRFFAKERL